MSYTIKNLREVEDAAAGQDFAEAQEARFARRALGAESTGLALQKIRAGKHQAFAHRHDEAEEIYVVLSGTGRIKLDDEVREIGPLDAIRIAPGVVRSLAADADADLEYLALGAHHEGDGELLPDVWSA